MKPRSIFSIIAPCLVVLTVFGVNVSAVTPPPKTPVFVTCPEFVKGSYCDGQLMTHLWATDGTRDNNRASSIRYHLVSGPGEIDERTGLWSWESPGRENIGSWKVEVSASIGNSPAHTTPPEDYCSFRAIVANSRPRFRGRCGRTITANVPGTKVIPFAAGDNDTCDVVEIFLSSFQPEPHGSVEFDTETGGLTFTADSSDAGTIFTATVGATDGMDTSYCTAMFDIRPASDLFKVRIETRDPVIPGLAVDVNILLENASASISGFNLLLGYDAEMMSFWGADVGESSIYQECEWEYFTYRYGPPPGCGDACPSGMARIVGIAETNNGPVHPACLLPDDSIIIMSKLWFMVSDDHSLENEFIPVDFVWAECEDNSLNSELWDTLLTAYRVLDREGHRIVDSNELPSFAGPPDSCTFYSGKVTNRRQVIFQNGGCQVIRSDSIESRGDITFDGIPYGRNDVQLFARYLVGHNINYPEGISAEDIAEAADVNGDGIPWTIEDFTYMVRVMNELPRMPRPPAPSQDTLFTHAFGDLNSIIATGRDSLGAALFTFPAEVTPHFTGDNMTMIWNTVAGETRVLFYNDRRGFAFIKELRFSYDGPNGLKEVVAATSMGRRYPTHIDTPTEVVEEPSDILPKYPALYQNFPNPFNITTTITFDLPRAADVRIDIFDITGRWVNTLRDGFMSAGRRSIIWDGTDHSGNVVASGVYLYRIKADSFVESRKMLLLK